jgi:gluconolactonase
MKRKLLLSLGAALCAFGIYSCQKDIKSDPGADALAVPGAKGGGPSAQSHIVDASDLIATDAEPIQLGASSPFTFNFTEGPSVDKKGNVFFTDQPNDKIYKWDAATDEITLFKTGTGRSNGTYFDNNGFLITCADMHGELWAIDKHGKHEKIYVDNYGGKLLNGPNDIWINPVNGGMYFTDPIFGRDYWDDSDPRKVNLWPGTSQQANPIGSNHGGYVYYLNPSNKQLTRVATEALGWSPSLWPNGIVGTPDGKKLYVNKWGFNTATSGTWVFDINSDGTLSNMEKFADMGGDGMTMDELGNVYICRNIGITVFNPDGDQILHISPPPGWDNISNACFGGQDGKTLFMTVSVGFGATGQGSVWGLQMNVKGAAIK